MEVVASKVACRLGIFIGYKCRSAPTSHIYSHRCLSASLTTVFSLAFKAPPSDGPLLFAETLANHAKKNPTHPLFRYVINGTLKTIPWSDAVRAFRRAAQFVQEQIKIVAPEKRPVVAILASIDQITYLSLVAGVLSAGYQVFPISPRNSELGVMHLLQSTNCSHVLVSAEATTQQLLEGVVAAITTQGGRLQLIPVPSFEHLFGVSNPPDFPPTPRPESDEVAIIMHSSGSVAFPKVIKITYHSLLQFSLGPNYGELDFCGEVWSTHATPPFHIGGLIQLFWAAFFGMTIAVFPPVVPPIIPTPERVFDDAVASNSTFLFCVPSFLESWAREPARLPALKQFKSVIVAGGPLQPAVGDMLHEKGVKIAHVYGLTETGGLNLFLPRRVPMESWNYFEFSPHIDPVFLPVDGMPNLYRLVVKKCETHAPAVLNTTVDGVPAFDTNDLLVQHPENHKLWKIYGRQDDQIMHSNGEKTNPAPLEAIILKDSRIKHAVMFGRSKFNAGVLLFPWDPFSPADMERVVEFRREIWPAVQKANEYAPTHSRIFKEMILIADPSKPLELTAKGTPRRAASLEMYKDEIRAIYAAAEVSSQTHLAPPKVYDAPSSINFVRSVVRAVMVSPPGDDEDIFQHGCDSLQATWIRNSILHALRTSNEIEIGTIPDDFVYSHPTMRLLADMLTKVASGASVLRDISLHASAMEEMVVKYSREFPEHCGAVDAPKTEAILVTGTTGALGCYTLAHLLTLPEISVVYAFNRTGGSIQERQRTAFVNNGIDEQLLTSPKLRLLEGSLSQTAFGLASDDYDEMREKVTCIIQNAWPVDFNMSISSMEPSVAGTRTLVDFALSSGHTTPPKFIFVSTAGIFRNFKGPIALEENISDPKISAGQGYAESKWVTEQMLEIATQKTALNPIIVRPGQLSGGVGGAWKTSEWFPILLRSSQLMGHLPAISGRISWVPIHQAAKRLASATQGLGYQPPECSEWVAYLRKVGYLA
ncbi:hypothetical protein C8R44DRAFT_302385 [Mycena epipterygia]|nr:hypothetical protein C8R44DRAFT_302385 [Mycena epipterygia]